MLFCIFVLVQMAIISFKIGMKRVLYDTLTGSSVRQKFFKLVLERK